MSKMIIKIPISEATKKKSAIDSSFFSLSGLFVLIATNENIQEKVRRTAITEVSSSMI
jgi:hypothetical protein